MTIPAIAPPSSPPVSSVLLPTVGDCVGDPGVTVGANVGVLVVGEREGDPGVTLGATLGALVLGALDVVDMDGALLLGEDIASGVTIERGQVRFPNENGCGSRLL